MSEQAEVLEAMTTRAERAEADWQTAERREAELVEALAFYADKKSWAGHAGCDPNICALADRGEKARNALIDTENVE